MRTSKKELSKKELKEWEEISKWMADKIIIGQGGLSRREELKVLQEMRDSEQKAESKPGVSTWKNGRGRKNNL